MAVVKVLKLGKSIRALNVCTSSAYREMVETQCLDDTELLMRLMNICMYIICCVAERGEMEYCYYI